MNNNFLAGFILGCLIGAAIAFVFAPNKRVAGEKGVALSAENQVVSTHYEAPRIILDEGMNASVAKDSTDV